MRMWSKSLTPFLCDKHLLGAHGELHKHRHSFVKCHSITGRISPIVQIEPWRMAAYHDELAAEMLHRGMNHNSPYEMPDISYLTANERWAVVDLEISRKDLIKRCAECRKNLSPETDIEQLRRLI